MEEESGEALRTWIIKTVTLMRESLNLIKNMDKEHFNGQAATLIQDHITEMKGMDME